MPQIQEITEILYAKFQSLIPEVPPEVQEIYQTAIDYYGEENVDLQFGGCQKILWSFLDNNNFGTLFTNFDLNIWEHEAFLSRRDHIVGDAFRHNEALLAIFLDLLTPEVVKGASKTFLYCILVRFQNFKVTNENDTTTSIEEMFVATHLDYEGRLCDRMKWCRTNTSGLHFSCGYRHSHLPTGGSGYHSWQYPCLGTGPICMTINTLESDYSIDLWPLYWHELDQCIRVESLSGGPYFKISDINSRALISNTVSSFNTTVGKWNQCQMTFKNEVLKDIIESGKVKFVWNRNHIEIANSLSDFTLLVSNSYIELLLRSESAATTAPINIPEILDREIALGNGYWGRFTDKDTIECLRSGVVQVQERTEVLDWKFKGEAVKFHVGNHLSGIKKYFLLNNSQVSLIYNHLTLLANITYGRIYKSGLQRSVGRH